MAKDARYDYDRQCWIVGGIIQRCNHPATMDCRCYGTEHAGEPAQPEKEVYGC